jgi:hypothetical protein
MAVKEMQNRTTNWTFDLHVENQLVYSTLNEKYFQRVEQSPIEIQGKNAKLCSQRCKLSKYVFMILTFSLWPWNSNRVCCYYTDILLNLIKIGWETSRISTRINVMDGHTTGLVLVCREWRQSRYNAPCATSLLGDN